MRAHGSCSFVLHYAHGSCLFVLLYTARTIVHGELLSAVPLPPNPCFLNCYCSTCPAHRSTLSLPDAVARRAARPRTGVLPRSCAREFACPADGPRRAKPASNVPQRHRSCSDTGRRGCGEAKCTRWGPSCCFQLGCCLAAVLGCGRPRESDVASAPAPCLPQHLVTVLELRSNYSTCSTFEYLCVERVRFRNKNVWGPWSVTATEAPHRQGR